MSVQANQSLPISVVLPTHNGGEHLDVAVQSILNQTHENLELLIIDDHSTDRSVSMLSKYDNRIRIIENCGVGIVAALNTGIQNARHPYLARMDADDIALPGRLETQLDYLQANPQIQICGAQVELFREDSEIGGGYLHYQRWINKQLSAQDIAQNMFVESPVPHPTVFMLKQHLLDLGGYRDVDWPEDYDLWLKAHINGYKFGKPNGILLRWRDHDQRLSRQSARYNKNAFFMAKAFYIKLYYPDREFRIWGSGPTGALLHDELVKQGASIIDFIDVADKRIGNQKRNKPIIDAYKIKKSQALILISVNARGAREDILEFLDTRGFKPDVDYVCLA